MCWCFPVCITKRMLLCVIFVWVCLCLIMCLYVSLCLCELVCISPCVDLGKALWQTPHYSISLLKHVRRTSSFKNVFEILKDFCAGKILSRIIMSRFMLIGGLTDMVRGRARRLRWVGQYHSVHTLYLHFFCFYFLKQLNLTFLQTKLQQLTAFHASFDSFLLQ